MWDFLGGVVTDPVALAGLLLLVGIVCAIYAAIGTFWVPKFDKELDRSQRSFLGVVGAVALILGLVIGLPRWIDDGDTPPTTVAAPDSTVPPDTTQPVSPTPPDVFAPILTDIVPVEVDEFETVSFTATLANQAALGGPLTFSLVDEPSDASIDSRSGEFRWRPGEERGRAAPYELEVVVLDGTTRLSDRERVRITVREVNAPPLIRGVDGEAEVQLDRFRVDADGSLEVSVDAHDANDDPPNTLKYRLETGPDDAEIDQQGTVRWQPGAGDDMEAFRFTVVVEDDGVPVASDVHEFEVVVGLEPADVIDLANYARLVTALVSDIDVVGWSGQVAALNRRWRGLDETPITFAEFRDALAGHVTTAESLEGVVDSIPVYGSPLVAGLHQDLRDAASAVGDALEEMADAFAGGAAARRHVALARFEVGALELRGAIVRACADAEQADPGAVSDRCSAWLPTFDDLRLGTYLSDVISIDESVGDLGGDADLLLERWHERREAVLARGGRWAVWSWVRQYGETEAVLLRAFAMEHPARDACALNAGEDRCAALERALEGFALALRALADAFDANPSDPDGHQGDVWAVSISAQAVTSAVSGICNLAGSRSEGCRTYLDDAGG